MNLRRQTGVKKIRIYKIVEKTLPRALGLSILVYGVLLGTSPLGWINAFKPAISTGLAQFGLAIYSETED